jgi:hypothetical protein
MKLRSGSRSSARTDEVIEVARVVRLIGAVDTEGLPSLEANSR